MGVGVDLGRVFAPSRDLQWPEYDYRDGLVGGEYRLYIVSFPVATHRRQSRGCAMSEEGPWSGAHSQWKAGQGQVQYRIGVPVEVLRELGVVIKAFPFDYSARAGRWVPAAHHCLGEVT